jgi:phage tail sheath protein FI
VASVISCTVSLTDKQQGPLNVPLNGKSIDGIRDFVGRGPVVWGARTLDGNSADWRYIQIRRTIVYIEQSIKQALNPFVFAANDAQTWTVVTAMISNFLTGLWSQGALLGDKASDAFTVNCGLGSTMTAQDILNGYMIVGVTLQMVHPGEFIELTFQQKMQGG